MVRPSVMRPGLLVFPPHQPVVVHIGDDFEAVDRKHGLPDEEEERPPAARTPRLTNASGQR